MNEESTTPSRNPVSLFFQRLSQVCVDFIISKMQLLSLCVRHVLILGMLMNESFVYSKMTDIQPKLLFSGVFIHCNERTQTQPNVDLYVVGWLANAQI